jgi:hypothetical protein
MALIPGTNIASRIVPFDTADTYATHDESYGRGGFRSVANITERNAIPSSRRKEGMLVFVVADDITYQLYGGTTDSDWRVYATGGGGSSLYGTVECHPDINIYTISHPTIPASAIVNATVKVPSVSAVQFISSISNNISGSFNVVLSSNPGMSGYFINWVVQNPS